jgi:hypothetical protein
MHDILLVRILAHSKALIIIAVDRLQVFAAILCAGAILTVTNNYETLHLTLPTFSFEAGKATNDEERLPLKKAVR